MKDPEFTLYTHYSSSAAFRVRIALNLKGIAAHSEFIHLVKDGGRQFTEAYRALNPQELVPTLVHEGAVLAQSLAIIEYLDEMHPEPPLLPKEPQARAHVRAIAYAVACDIHPLNNLRVRKYLLKEWNRSQEEILGWQRHWMAVGFNALERMLAKEPGKFCHGDTPTLADCCLIPQLVNAHRAEMSLSPWPILMRIEKAALELPAFSDALPKNQPDAE